MTAHVKSDSNYENIDSSYETRKHIITKGETLEFVYARCASSLIPLRWWLLLTSSYTIDKTSRSFFFTMLHDDVTNFSCLVALHCRHFFFLRKEEKFFLILLLSLRLWISDSPRVPLPCELRIILLQKPFVYGSSNWVFRLRASERERKVQPKKVKPRNYFCLRPRQGKTSKARERFKWRLKIEVLSSREWKSVH